MGPYNQKGLRGYCNPGYIQETTFARWMVLSGEAEKDKIWALQRLTKYWSSLDLAIYTDCSATNGTSIGGGGILLTADHASNPTNLNSYAIPAGSWCSSFQAEMKAIKKALHIIQTEESLQNVRIDSDSQSVLLRIANFQPAIPHKSADEFYILSLLAALNDEGHQTTFTWCNRHCGVVWNEMADEQARRGSADNQEDARHNYDSAKATIRRATKGEEISHEIPMKSEKLDRIDESKLSTKEQRTMGRQRNCHQPELKYWWKNRARSRHHLQRMRIGEETAEHVVHDCPRIHQSPHEPTPRDTLAKDLKKVLRIWDRGNSVSDLPYVSQPGITTT